MSEEALVPTVVTAHDFSGPRLTPQKKAVALQLVAGRKPQEIARRFNITTDSIRAWEKQPLFQAEMARLQEGQEEFVLQANENMRDLCPTATANIADIITRPIPTMDDTNIDKDIRGSDIAKMAKLQIETSFKVLATQGVSPVSKQSIKAVTTKYNADSLLMGLAEEWERKRAKGS